MAYRLDLCCAGSARGTPRWRCSCGRLSCSQQPIWSFLKWLPSRPVVVRGWRRAATWRI